jgi:beta-galactosidase
LGRWLAAGLNQIEISTQNVSAKENRDGTVTLDIQQVGTARGGNIQHQHSYTFLPDGDIIVDNVVIADKTLPDLPRVGVTLSLVPELESLSWFGRGPHDNYCDRKRGSHIELYSSTVTEQYVPYIMPQEHGHKTDVRWFSLEQKGQRGLLFSGENLLEFSASHFSADDLFRAHHTTDLQPRPEVIVNIDCAHRGLGTNSCGPDTLEQYLIQPGEFRFRYRIRPYANGEQPQTLARENVF